MAWLRFETRRGINLDNVDEWTYEDKPVPPQPTATRAATRSGGTRPASADGGTETTTAEVASPAAAPEPGLTQEPQTVPTMHLLMTGGREITLEGEDATKVLAFLVGMTGAL